MKRIGILTVFGLLSACGLPPEVPCGFYINSSNQRVSWNRAVPVHFWIHHSVPIQYRTSIENAAQAWNQVAGRELILLEGIRNDGDGPANDGISTIYWSETWVNGPNLIGVTRMKYSESQMREADISFNAEHFQFFVGLPAVLWKMSLDSVAVHEFGHALGLAHSEAYGSVMYPSLAYGQYSVQPNQTETDNLKCEY